MKLNVVDLENKKLSEIEFGQTLSAFPLVRHHNYLMANYFGNALRQGSASSKTRGEVSGGGAKPYRQKGTGHARRGSNRTPLRRGGGVVFGPKPRNFETQLNAKLIKKALKDALLLKENQVVVLSTDEAKLLKTSEFAAFLKKNNIASKETVAVVLDGNELNLWYGVRNLRNVVLVDVNFMNVVDLLRAKLVLFTPSTFEKFNKKVSL